MANKILNPKSSDPTCDKCVRHSLLNRVQLPSWRSSALRCPVQRSLYKCQCSCPVHAIDEKGEDDVVGAHEAFQATRFVRPLSTSKQFDN